MARLKKILKLFFLTLIILIAILTLGRMVQKYLDSQFTGVRGPYLQMLGSDRVTIRWQSLDASTGQINYGSGQELVHSVKESEAVESHELQLKGLQSSTRYNYQIVGSKKVEWFVTAPDVTDDKAVRLWVQGDPGYYRKETQSVKNQAMHWMEAHPRGTRPPFDLWLTTGDNAYKSGKQKEFQSALFDAYPELLPHYPYWPAYGNHDARRWSFFKNFTFPEAGELGGAPSGTEHYFSFNYGQLHLIYLDTETESLAPNDDMALWLKKDLFQNRNPWVIAVFHHPPYTKGGHNSDDTWEGLGDKSWDSLGRMVDVRENILPILEAGGVDMVLSGHSHVYERSFQLHGHYGFSSSLTEAMVIDRDNCLTKGMGTNYLVIGSSAKSDSGSLDHPVMKFSTSKRGSQVIDVESGKLTSTFIAEDGTVLDQFMILDETHGKKEGSLGCPL
ncbi:MAG: metallophosphoesterase family protein [Chromatiales bacterium]|nr:metallophosphoesterase family protein [Chromatiales bacterium]